MTDAQREPGERGPDNPIRSEFGQDPEMLDLIELFVGELSERVSKLREAWRTGQIEYVRMEAHRLKGAAPGYGFTPIGQAAGRLEHTLTDASASDLESLAQAARAEFDELIDLCGRAAA